MLGRKMPRAQSAMEYLMTYGWAILIIAVVLGALFSLGVFGGGSLVGTACVASPGYLCSSPTLGVNGQISFTFGQNTGSTLYDLEFACAATSGSTGLPANMLSFSPISSTGAGVANTPANYANSPSSSGFVSGQTISVSGLPCYGTTGLPLDVALNWAGLASGTGNAAIGTSFSGYIWLNYTASQCTAATCTWYTIKMATLSLKLV